jgi:predicted nucleic acid-binding protein
MSKARCVADTADFIVTGDEDLLVLHPFRAIQILTPRDFLDALGEVE